MIEHVEIINNISIKYKLKPRKYDARHVIFIFSGFGGGGRLFTYDFENALQNCPAHVVWIKDDFDASCAYYICQNLQFTVEEAVHLFILAMLERFGLEKHECTLAGFSKGGSAALYFTLKYNFPSVIATVPQFHIGSYVSISWPQVGEKMAGEITKDNINYLDSLLPTLLLNDRHLDKNIYLLTSRADVQYATDIEPYIGYFDKYSNFNYFMANSQLIREHNQVTSYHVPLLLGIFYSLCQGAVPRYGKCELNADNRLRQPSSIIEPITILKRISLNGDTIFPEGIAVLKGINCGEYSDIHIELVFKSDDSEMTFPMAKHHRSILTRQLYEEGFVNYDKGWFCTTKFQGLSLERLPPGLYQLFLNINCQGYKAQKALGVDVSADNQLLASGKEIDIRSENGVVWLWKKR